MFDGSDFDFVCSGNNNNNSNSNSNETKRERERESENGPLKYDNFNHIFFNGFCTTTTTTTNGTEPATQQTSTFPFQ